jgi:hypothetical protein
MPVEIRAYVVIMLVGLMVLAVGKPIVTAYASTPEDYRRRAATWVAVTSIAFFSHSYWLFVLISTPLIWLVGTKDSSRFSLFLFLVFAVPPFRVDVPGFGGMPLMQVNHIRWLTVALLLPAWINLRKEPGYEPFGRLLVDKFLIAYVLLWLVLNSVSTTVTNLMRIGFYFGLDIILPYIVASRALRDLRAYRDAIMSFLVAALLIGPLGLLELVRSWLLYNWLDESMGLPRWGFGNYLPRDAFLRGAASTGHPIVLGYVMVVGLGLTLYLRSMVESGKLRALIIAGLGAGLLGAMSRGPWVAGAVMGVVIVLTAPNAGKRMMQAALGGMLVIGVAIATPQGQRAIDYLPWIGTVESQNVDFRERLLEVSLGVLAHYPFFGALDFLNHPDMEQMRGGDGIIDMVNEYLAVAMATGIVGLSLFVAPFVLAGVGIARVLRTVKAELELHLLGRALLAALVGIMVTIATVAAITVVPIVYLSIIGMSVGYLRLVARMRAEQRHTSLADPAAIRPPGQMAPMAPRRPRRRSPGPAGHGI